MTDTSALKPPDLPADLATLPIPEQERIRRFLDRHPQTPLPVLYETLHTLITHYSHA